MVVKSLATQRLSTPYPSVALAAGGKRRMSRIRQLAIDEIGLM